MFAAFPEPLLVEQGLASLSLEDLAAVGERLGFQEELTSKARLLADLPAKLCDKATVRRLIRDLEGEAAEALWIAAAAENLYPALGPSLLFRFGATAPPGELVRRALLLPDAATGFLRPPAALLEALHAEAAKRFLPPPAEPPATAVSVETSSAFRDAAAIWCYLIKNPITLTQSGATPKRALAKLIPLLEVPEEEGLVAAAAEAFGFSRLEALAAALERGGAVRRDDSTLLASPWLEDDVASAERLFPLEFVRGAVEKGESAAALLAAYALNLAPPETWVSAAALVERAAAAAGPASEAAARETLFAAFVAGFAAAGGAEEDLRLARTAELGPTEPPPAAEVEFLVGGNFELKVPYEVPTALRLRIEAFADQTGGGRYPSFLLSKGSVYRALDAGVSAEEIVAFLNAHASRPLPQNVEFSLRDWAEQYGAVAFYDGLVVAADTPEKADEIAQLPSLAQYVKGRRELYAVELARKDYGPVRDELQAAGYLPRSLPDEPATPVSARALFDAPEPAREGRARVPAGKVGAILAFAVENGRELRLWLAEEEEPLDVQPTKLTSYRGEAFLHVAGNRERPRIPVAAIARATFR
ncbi:MAG: helicase-associated domain-containing protein [Candidatus Coatesbacteria bacterium]|nr:MAG: helicase-associated domain-containing protein [Candidatus Coatesbacteria bacterium]